MAKQLFIMSILLGCALSSYAQDVDGVLGMSVVGDRSCVAIKLSHDPSSALTGVRWYNNDGTASFPGLYATAGDQYGVGPLDAAQMVVSSVIGTSSGWSEVVFDVDTAGVNGVLYLVFQMPEASVQVGEGAGGGAGFGYRNVTEGNPAWLSLDGSSWDQLYDLCELAIEPLFGVKDDQTLVLEPIVSKSLPGYEEDLLEDPDVPLITALHPPHPNPFNPQTKLQFTLAESGRIELAVYDLLGRLVDKPAEGVYAAGPHEITWTGRDRNGRVLASGAYLLRLQTPTKVMTGRMMLVR